MQETEREPYDVFLSHSRGEAEVARDLASLLRSAELRVFLAEDTIAAGENWYRAAEEAVGNASVTVVLIGPGALSSPWMTAEWRAAASGAMRGQSLLIPVLVGDVDASEMPATLRQFQAVRLDTPDAMAHVAQVIERAITTVEVAPGEPDTLPAPVLPVDYFETGVADRIAVAIDAAIRDRSGPVKVVGPPGAGKTTAMAAAWRATADRWEVSIWINASSEHTVLRGLAQLGRRLGHVQPDGEPEQLAAAALDRLASTDARWLVVLDDAEGAQSWLARWTPPSSATGTAVVITRHELGLGGHVVRLEPLDRGLALSQLERRLGTPLDGDARRALLELLAAIGDATPLSITLLAAQLTRDLAPIADRIERLRGQLDQGASPDLAQGVQAAVARGLQELASRRPLSAKIGQALAISPGIGLPVSLLQGAADDPFLAADADKVTAALAELESTGFVRTTAAGAVLTHLLVALVIRRDAPATDALRFLTRAATRRRNAGRRDAMELAALNDIARHALAASVPATPRDESAAAAELGLEVARALLDDGDAPGAVDLLEATLAVSERTLGPSDVTTLTTRSNLAGALRAVGQPERAITLLEQTLDDSERTLGSDDPSTLSTRANLAATFKSVGRLEDALLLLEQTLADSERVLGADHPSTLSTRAELAAALQSLGRVAEATSAQERTLTDSERVLGPDHPSTLSQRARLAALAMVSGRLEQARALWEQTAADSMRLLGPEHPSTLVATTNLAAALRATGRTEEAIALLAETLAASERVLGSEDPLTDAVRHNLDYVRGVGGRSG